MAGPQSKRSPRPSHRLVLTIVARIPLERLLQTLVILRGPIRVDMCEIFLVCLVAVAFPTLARLLVDPLFGLSFGKEAYVAVQVSHLRDQLRHW